MSTSIDGGADEEGTTEARPPSLDVLMAPTVCGVSLRPASCRAEESKTSVFHNGVYGTGVLPIGLFFAAAPSIMEYDLSTCVCAEYDRKSAEGTM